MASPPSVSPAELAKIRDEVIVALRDFYTFLSQLPWIEPHDILEAPEPHGWPNINSENFKSFGKTDEVFAVLRHLPYLRMDGPNKEYTVAYSTYPCDYRRDYFQSALDFSIAAPWEVPETEGRGFKFPGWVVPLTYGKNHGEYLMLDVTDGTVWRYQAMGFIHEPAYLADDAQSWRNECVEPGRTRRLKDVLDIWKTEYAELRWIGFPRAGSPHIWISGNKGYDDIRDLIISHGWPHNFDRQGCRQALIEWEQKQL